MFGIGLLVAYTLLVGYVLWRASSAAWLASRVKRRHWLALGAALWLLFVVGRFAAHDATASVAALVELVALDLLVALFLAACCLLVVEIVTAGGFVLRRLAPRLRLGALLVGAALTGTAIVQGLRAPAVTDHVVVLPGLPAARDRTVIVALSDLHVGRTLDEHWLAARVAEVRALEPDVIVLLGDIVEGRYARSGQMLAPLGALTAPLGVWVVLGNHDRSRTPTAGLSPDAPFERWGIRVLHDASIEIAPGLVLTGVDDLTARRRSGDAEGAVERALASRPSGATVLLSHTPWQVEQAAAGGVGLMLAGHTHGGQVWPFGVLVGLMYPHVAGRYDVAGMTLLVSRGTGTWGPRMRLWHRGEILRVTLRAPDALGRAPALDAVPGAS